VKIEQYKRLSAGHPNRGGRAHGRLKGRGMNVLETDYAAHLEVRKWAGEIEWWGYECIKLRLADNTFYTPDFLVLCNDGTLEVHEVKGFWEDDARVKIKVAAENFPFVFVAVQKQTKKDGGGWKTERFE
jgi:hypothetical protein